MYVWHKAKQIDRIRQIYRKKKIERNIDVKDIDNEWIARCKHVRRSQGLKG